MEWFDGELHSSISGVRVDLRAKIATEIIKSNGILLGKPEGEDSAGRSITRNMHTQDTVARAVEMADLLVNEFEKRNWIKKGLTHQEEWKLTGELEVIKDKVRFSDFREKLKKE